MAKKFGYFAHVHVTLTMNNYPLSWLSKNVSNDEAGDFLIFIIEIHDCSYKKEVVFSGYSPSLLKTVAKAPVFTQPS